MVRSQHASAVPGQLRTDPMPTGGRFGKAVELPESNGAKIFQAESFGSVKVIYQRAGEIGGVFDIKDAEKARKFVENYLEGKLR